MIKVIKGNNDLASQRPELLCEWEIERNTKSVYVFSKKEVHWICRNCGQSWVCPVVKRVNGAACPWDSGRFSWFSQDKNTREASYETDNGS